MAYGGKRDGAGRKKGSTTKLTKAMAEIARGEGENNIKKLIKLRDKCLDPNVQLKATKELLDRGFGKPTQDVNLMNTDGSLQPQGINIAFTNIDTAALERAATEIAAQLASQEDPS